ncbi:TRAP transporter small permease [Bacillus sp. Marseille-P3661]|uniref:TRAP transporter small permease n=1 Tax=Bacillus sp. Marseille-P3661 TaxID=1936234 RepID=UPI000C82CB03|nr:TRAP transporter small permease [Bacillus sp. Marseille-P3661]
MSLFKKISNGIDAFVRGTITIFLAIMTVVLTIQIVARFVFQSGTIWSDELSRYLMVWMVFLGAAVLTKNGGHITVSIIEDYFPSTTKWLAPIQKIVSFIYAIILTKYGFDTLQIVGQQISPNMGISMGIVYSIIPIFSIIMIIHILFDFKGKINREEGMGGS